MQCARFNVDRAYTHVRRALMIMENAMTIVKYTDGCGIVQFRSFADVEAAFDFADTVADATVTEETMWDRADRMAREARAGT